MNQNDAKPIVGFTSALARKVAAIGIALGSLGALGFLPGCHRLFGFTGFFGFVGVAFIIEGISRFLRAH